MNRTARIAAGLGHAVKVGLVGLAACGLAACGFAPSGVTGGDGDGAVAIDAPSDGRDPIDAPVDGPVDIDAAQPPAALCDDDAANLVLCLSFDTNQATNGAPNGLQANRSTATPVLGRVGTARLFSGVASMWWNASAAWELGAPMSAEAFINYTLDPPHIGMPGDQRAGVIDGNAGFSMFLGWHDPDGGGPMTEQVTPYCNLSGVVWGTPISRNVWHHVACVLANNQLAIYVDGVLADANSNSTTTSPTNVDGLTLGQDCTGMSDQGIIEDALNGSLDEVRVWKAVRTPAQIAAAAQRGQ